MNGQKSGHGKLYFDNGKIKFEGEFKNDKKNGKGKKYYPDGKIKFEGTYLDDSKYNGILYRYENNREKKIIYLDGNEVYRK